ncbi:MAG: hypothetical protein C0505_04785 [Leptothrix sp. (in: Bacteria)]|nr:hypothetical protein [Leptothrix sp. (in: b-proteobacteria)]
MMAAVAATLSGCYVVPVQSPDGRVIYEHYPLPPAGVVVPMPPAAAPGAGPAGSMPAVLSARLYPVNELATQTGIVTGVVTNLMTGKGRFTVNYLGDVLVGEATRVSNEDRRGVASAFGTKGTFMSCEYQMTTPYQGTGDCTFSNGATYKLHLGEH